MSANLSHTVWLKKAGQKVTTSDGVSVDVFELQIDHSMAQMLSAWAKSFREHYCLDTQIDRLRRGTGKSRADYLTDMVFPDVSHDFGPATRSGDFAEILIADLLESQFGFWAPRTRYDDKLVRNESPKGTDVLAFKFHGASHYNPSRKDVLISFESKAQLSGNKVQPRLQDAVKDSIKDVYRISESLNAIKRRLINRGDEHGADRIERFQNGLEIPYVRMTGAAAVFCSSVYDSAYISETTNCAGHENVDNLMLVVVHANTLMAFVHTLYERAANEA
ncbi:Hachiman antiphage defense system protein HamA [Shewanella vesiculosa]|uniref:Hachiman antiphage defense system protein HamA n=1 Tax=Shewanella vesiculosa TaxID=518738 RepID=A0ABV0FUN4_9GAMM